MKQLFFFIVMCLSATGSSAQQADEILKSCINNKDFFNLEHLYRTHSGRTSFFFSQLCDGLIAAHKGQSQISNQAFEQLINREKCDSPLFFFITSLMADQYMATSEYAKVFQIYSRAVASLHPEQDQDMIRTLKGLRQIASHFKTEPALRISFPKRRNKLPYFLNNGMPFVQAQFGETPVNALFDTGAQENIVTRDIARKAGMKIIQEPVEMTGLAGKQIFADIAIAPQVGMGGISLSNVRFLVIDEPFQIDPVDPKQGIEAIIGWPLIRQFGVIQINPNKKEMQIVKNGKLKKGEKMLLVNRSLWVQLCQQDTAAAFLIDTGLSKSTLREEFLTGYFPEIICQAPYETIGNITADGYSEQKSKVIPALSFKCGKSHIRLSHLPVENSPSQMARHAGRLGADFLFQSGKATLDFNQMLIAFQ